MLIKLVIGLPIVAIIFLGLIAVKLALLLEFSEVSNLSAGRSLEGAKGAHLEADNIIDAIIKSIVFLSTSQIKISSLESISIGIIGFILLLLSLLKYKNKYVITFSILILILFILSYGGFLFKILYNYFPGYDRQHHIARSLYLVPLFASILIGFGTQNLFKLIKIKNKVILNSIYSLIIILLMANIGFFTGPDYDKEVNKFNTKDLLEQNEMMTFIKNEKENEIFRIHSANTNNYMGSTTMLYSGLFDLETTDGSVNIWITEYLNEYLIQYGSNNPYRFLGMLNTKYIYSTVPINNSNLLLVNKFKECELCRNMFGVNSGDGPYLYENKEYLPRAYLANNAILVAGNSNSAKQVMYSLLLHKDFNPSSTVIITLDPNKMDLSEDILNKFNAIILVNNIQNLKFINQLKEYYDNGGKVIPNIFEEKNQISEEDINNIMANLQKTGLEKLEISDYKPNSYKVSTKDKSGFLVLSEKFFMFDGWKAKSNKQSKEIYRANGINSAVFIKEDDYIKLNYSPKSYRRYIILFNITLLIILIYFSYLIYLKFKKKN